jgi:hypothetical protein
MLTVCWKRRAKLVVANGIFTNNARAKSVLSADALSHGISVVEFIVVVVILRVNGLADYRLLRNTLETFNKKKGVKWDSLNLITELLIHPFGMNLLMC